MERRKENRMIFRVIGVILVFIGVIVFAKTNVLAKQQKVEVYYVKVVVQHGDTLQTIANKYNGDQQDDQEYVKYIKKFNLLRTDTLQCGKSIVVPVWSSSH